MNCNQLKICPKRPLLNDDDFRLKSSVVPVWMINMTIDKCTKVTKRKLTDKYTLENDLAE